MIPAGLQGEHRSIEFMRLALTDKWKVYGRAPAIKRHAFETLSRRRLWFDVKEHNTRARAAYEKEWFRHVGAPRERLKSPEVFESLIVMSGLEQERRAT